MLTLHQKIILVYYMSAIILAFLLFGIDKAKARTGHWRIPERILFLVGLLGGAMGGLSGMVIFKHKLSKAAFVYGMPLLGFAHMILFAIVVLCYR